MNFWKSAAGMVEGKMFSADPEGCLEAFRQAGISIECIVLDDPMTVRFRIHRQSFPLCCRICQKRGAELHLYRYLGFHWTVRRLIRRPALSLGIGMLFLMTLFLSGRILFIEVDGNISIPSREIIEAAEGCGIRFGVIRREVRSEKMKNQLLQRLPRLQWAGINTSGCRAVISVRERQEWDHPDAQFGLRYVVAKRDGVITSCVVTSGNGLCAPGQVVKKGQVLISPYTDCGISLRVSNAFGEIFAQTIHDTVAVAPLERFKKQGTGQTSRKISLLFGKKRINLFKGSGICEGSCDRMYMEYYITLPGGFRLPAGIAVETITQWDACDTVLDPDALKQPLAQYARVHLTAGMISGEILESELSFRKETTALILDGNYICSEMIGREITQKIGEKNGQISGEDR